MSLSLVARSTIAHSRDMYALACTTYPTLLHTNSINDRGASATVIWRAGIWPCMGPVDIKTVEGLDTLCVNVCLSAVLLHSQVCTPPIPRFCPVIIRARRDIDAGNQK